MTKIYNNNISIETKFKSIEKNIMNKTEKINLDQLTLGQVEELAKDSFISGYIVSEITKNAYNSVLELDESEWDEESIEEDDELEYACRQSYFDMIEQYDN